MYIDRVHITNIRCFKEITWDLGNKPRPGWHVIIGDNGSGKSSFLRAVILALLGQDEAKTLLLDWRTYLRDQAEQSEIEVNVTREMNFDAFLSVPLPGLYFIAPLKLRKIPTSEVILDVHFPTSPESFYHRNLFDAGFTRTTGWFSAAYGPFRRFTGGDPDKERLYKNRPVLARHLTLFREDVALPEALTWLQSLQFQKLESAPNSSPPGELLDTIRKFVNQAGFLPYGVQLTEVSSQGVKFEDGNGMRIAVEDLSDGYRSILSLTFDLLRHLSLAYPDQPIFSGDKGDKEVVVQVPGVVLIDEVDVHLHPSWQRQIGPWFRKHFPNMQFIVTTHSPLVCQAAEVGTVFRLPSPGNDEEGAFVEGAELDRLLYGDILDAYSTNLFGISGTRSEHGQEKLERFASLNLKALRKGLNPKEREEQENLRQIFSSMPSTLDPESDEANGR